ncbi:MAG: ABC transporter permease [Calditrichaceae bacterium]|nr:ABC transporter permease [Calditrichia bacterium]NUQ41343.1 ABC transporter permease [Calditrichaceae bacterium]
MNQPLIQLILIQFKEFYREPGIIFWGIVFPILMAWGLGVAFTSKAEQIRNVALIESRENPNLPLRRFLEEARVAERKPGGVEKEYIKSVGDEKLGTIQYHFIPADWERAMALLKRGTVALILEEKNGAVQYHFDPHNSDAHLSYLQLSAALEQTAPAGLSAGVSPLTQAGARYIDFLVPGLIAMGIMMSAMWGISYSLIEKRNKKLLRRMVATPMKRSGFLISHFIARVALSLLETFLLYLFVHYYFGITIQGNLLALLLMMVAGMLAFTGIAIFVSSRTAKLEIANGLINTVTMPMMVLSGIFFSYHNFPEAVVPYIRILPLTMLADGIRAIFIEGAGLAEQLWKILVLSGVGVGFFAAGLKIYKWY